MCRRRDAFSALCEIRVVCYQRSHETRGNTASRNHRSHILPRSSILAKKSNETSKLLAFAKSLIQPEVHYFETQLTEPVSRHNLHSGWCNSIAGQVTEHHELLRGFLQDFMVNTGSYDGKDIQADILPWTGVWTTWWVPTFRRNIFPPSSGTP